MSKPATTYLKDYLPPSYFVDTIELTFHLAAEKTHVKNRMHVRRNAAFTKPNPHLVLNGCDQTLISVHVNGEALGEKQYQLDKETLTILNVPDTFELMIESTHVPEKNTHLMGLYASRGILCTQCESEGFRYMTYALDRPDVLSRFTVTLIADKKRYPQLLSNGNRVSEKILSTGEQEVTWQDPFPKPTYLFALVAGDLSYIEDFFVTQSGRRVTLRIYSTPEFISRCQFAMEAVKKSMRWDEETYGREYDLDLFMIVAIEDFNVGAMENKGLNIFNTRCLLADPNTTTDAEYDRIMCVVAHEYFHNWTGDRVTCRDWFQLSLKEGLTVFRDQTFSEDEISPSVTRIKQVERLRDLQFSEDASALSHPVQPASYIEIDNFYTMTIYEKGAEVIRMMRTLLGKEKFRAGMDLYFERHDGEAVTCEDFVKAMEDASGIDLTQFRLWYSQAGTPALTVEEKYDANTKEYELTLEQATSKTPGQFEKKALHVPVSIALFDSAGTKKQETVLSLRADKGIFRFGPFEEKPHLSLLRGFSAPVKYNYEASPEDYLFLMKHDDDDFARFEAAQNYLIHLIKPLKSADFPADGVHAFQQILAEPNIQNNLKACLLQFPTEVYLSQYFNVVDVDAIHTARETLMTALAKGLKTELEMQYEDLHTANAYEYNVSAVGDRSLKNMALAYLMQLKTPEWILRCFEQYQNAAHMTDRYAALSLLANTDHEYRYAALSDFKKRYEHDFLVMDKWLTVQALSPLPDTLSRVRSLLKDETFDIKNPNRVRSLLINFAKFNPVRFHDQSGEGYALLAEQALKIDAINPHVSSRMLEVFSRYRRYDSARQKLMREQLEILIKHPHLSKNAYEIITRTLEAETI